MRSAGRTCLEALQVDALHWQSERRTEYCQAYGFATWKPESPRDGDRRSYLSSCTFIEATRAVNCKSARPARSPKFVKDFTDLPTSSQSVIQTEA